MNTTSTVTPISETPKQPQQWQTAKDIIAARKASQTKMTLMRERVCWKSIGELGKCWARPDPRSLPPEH